LFYQRRQIKTIKGKVLDQYLEKGWFRVGNSIFTSQFFFFDENMFSTVWLRTVLNGFKFKKRHRKLFNKVNNLFTKMQVELSVFEHS